jgi:putative ABC transport system permease protein
VATTRRAVLWAAISLLGINGCAIAASNGSLESWQATLAPVAFSVASGANAMFAAAMAPIVVGWIGPRVARHRASGRLAVANLTSHPGRTAVMSVALGTTVGIAFLTASYTAATRHTITDNLVKHLHGVSVSTLEPNNTGNIDAKLSDDEVTRLGQLPGVARVDRSAFLVVGHDMANLIAVSGYSDPWLDGEVLDGSIDRSRFDGGEVLVGPKLARSRNLRAGSTLPLDTPSGVVSLPVLAVVQNGDFSGNNVVMPLPLLEHLYGRQPPQNINLVTAPGYTDEQLATEVKAAGIDQSLRVRTAAELADDISNSVEQQLTSFWALQRGLMFTAFVAVLSTLLLVGVQRRREIALLAAVGMQPGELARMVFAEAGIVAVVGVVLGALTALPMFGALLLVGPIVIGYREPFMLDISSAITYGAIAVVVALAAAALPAWRTSRVEVLAGLQYE